VFIQFYASFGRGKTKRITNTQTDGDTGDKTRTNQQTLGGGNPEQLLASWRDDRERDGDERD
jgi:hypothetical protein